MSGKRLYKLLGSFYNQKVLTIPFPCLSNLKYWHFPTSSFLLRPQGQKPQQYLNSTYPFILDMELSLSALLILPLEHLQYQFYYCYLTLNSVASLLVPRVLWWHLTCLFSLLYLSHQTQVIIPWKSCLPLSSAISHSLFENKRISQPSLQDLLKSYSACQSLPHVHLLSFLLIHPFLCPPHTHFFILTQNVLLLFYSFPPGSLS